MYRNLALLLCLLMGASASAASYKLDKDHTTVGFSVSHLGVSKVKGNFNDFEGKIDYDKAKAKDTKIDVTIQTKSIDTANEKRDEHLRSGDFLNADKNPTIKFVSKKVTSSGPKKMKIVGDLTINGITKEVALDATINGVAKDPWGNERLGASATGKIKRKDFGVTWNKSLDNGGVLVGEEVSLNLEVEALLSK